MSAEEWVADALAHAGVFNAEASAPDVLAYLKAKRIELVELPPVDETGEWDGIGWWVTYVKGSESPQVIFQSLKNASWGPGPARGFAAAVLAAAAAAADGSTCGEGRSVDPVDSVEARDN